MSTFEGGAMKSLLQLGVCVLSLVALTSCNKVSFDSTITVNKTFTIQGMLNKKLNLDVGTHEAKFDVSANEKKLRLTVGDQRVTFKLPKLFEVEQVNQGITILSSDLKQDFDLVAKVSDQSWQGSEISTTESCSEVIGTETVCTESDSEIVCTEENGRRICRKVGGETTCKEVDVTREGRQDVSYYNNFQQKLISVDFKAPQTNDVMAHLEGKSDVLSSKHYTSVGECVFNKKSFEE